MEMKFCPRCASSLTTREDSGRVRVACPDSDCAYVFYDNPTAIVAALIEHDGEVILARNKDWDESWFGLVTGYVERDEAPDEAILREVREGLGLTGHIVALIGVYSFPAMNQLIVAYHVQADGEIRMGDKLEEIKRVAPDDLQAWPFGTGLAVSDWLERRRP